MPKTSKYLGSCGKKEGKYLKLVNFAFVRKAKVLPAVWMDLYMEVCIVQVYFERVISFSDGTHN